MTLLTFTEVAIKLGISLPTARALRPQLPMPVRIGKRNKWPAEALDEFIRLGGCRVEAEKAAEAKPPIA